MSDPEFGLVWSSTVTVTVVFLVALLSANEWKLALICIRGRAVKHDNKVTAACSLSSQHSCQNYESYRKPNHCRFIGNTS